MTEDGMRARVILWAAIAAAAATSTPARAGQQLKVVEVSASAVYCLYSPSCTVTAEESVGQLALKELEEPDTAWVVSRTFIGAAGTPGAGKTGYEYRFDLTKGTASESAPQCVGGIVVNFGPVSQLPFKDNTPADVYVVTEGGPGTIGLASAEYDDPVITFTFAKLICLSDAPNPASATFLFGLASVHPPKQIAAGVFATRKPPYYNVTARAPKHSDQ
jgi:hypothetical protein